MIGLMESPFMKKLERVIMSTRLRLTKDYNGYKSGDVVELRSAEAKQFIKDKAAVVQTDLASQNFVTKEISHGNTTKLRSYNRRRR